MCLPFHIRSQFLFTFFLSLLASVGVPNRRRFLSRITIARRYHFVGGWLLLVIFVKFHIFLHTYILFFSLVSLTFSLTVLFANLSLICSAAFSLTLSPSLRLSLSLYLPPSHTLCVYLFYFAEKLDAHMISQKRVLLSVGEWVFVWMPCIRDDVARFLQNFYSCWIVYKRSSFSLAGKE